ncbi:MAG: SLBB domain-containing protein [Armatimonadota bacterium]|nr:SLBB domain-containing protein [Armatimonadota bacterium]
MAKLGAIVALFGLAAQVLAAPAKTAPASMTVTITGHVLRPDLYEVRQGADLREALALAGGFTLRPDLVRVTVERGPGKVVSVSASALFEKKKQQPLRLNLHEYDFIRVERHPPSDPDPLMAYKPRRKAQTTSGDPRDIWKSFEFNGLKVYVIPLPEPNISR